MEECLITPEIVSEICGYIRAGADFQIAAMAAGFKDGQISELQMLLPVATDGVWKEFADDIRKALAQFEVMQLMKINAEGGARGSQWLLERKNPEKYEKKKQESAKEKPENNKLERGKNHIDILSKLIIDEKKEIDSDFDEANNYLDGIDLEKLL